MRGGATRPRGLEVRDLTVAYGSQLALDGVSLTCAAGQIVGLLGPNGSGKTTLLRAVLGLTPRLEGTVEVDGEPLTRQRRAAVAYTPQRNEVDWGFPITVEEVVVLGRQGRRGLFSRPGRADWEAARAALDRLGVADLRQRPIGELSGGQQQRVFLARSLAQEGPVWLLDEPLNGVDAQTQTVVLDLLAELRAEGRAILLTTHDLARAAALCDRICLLNRRVIAEGPPADVLTPATVLEAYGGSEVLPVAGGNPLVGFPHGAGPDALHHHGDPARWRRP